MFNLLARKIFGSVNDRTVKSLMRDVDKISSYEVDISKLADDELRDKTDYFKELLKSGKTVDDILHEAFAVVREAAKRVLNMRHFDVQLMGGIVLHQGKISEMKTGEGKTLVATLPCYLNSLTGDGVHVVTVNDYLAKRDSAWMGKVYEFLGLTVGCITNDVTDEERRAAYQCDITYATNNELGFDYLRDNLRYSLDDMAQRGHNFAIIDEVDSILIDEARTPLIISGPTDSNSDLYKKINKLILSLDKDDYQLEEKEQGVFLTEKGNDRIEKLLKASGLVEPEANLYDPAYIDLVHHVNQALKAHKTLKNETDYIVKDNKVIIIDEFTGRMQEGRRFSDGLHQALEAKEGIKIHNENQTLASITFQNYFRLYKKLGGMTGTAMTESVEFEEIYNLKVVEIPTHIKINRIDEDDEIYKTAKSKYDAIVKSVKEANKKGQPTLIGTVSIEKSEMLSKLLKANKLPHKVLNAKYHEQEAEIIEQAGVSGAITIATNMAGRGTDIMLGGNAESLINKLKKPTELQIKKIHTQVSDDKKKVIKAGGLYVLGTERHESRRIDNQLRGRSGRQGDVGRTKFFLSLEDDLMRIFGSEKLQSLLSTFGLKEDEAIYHPWITKTLEGAQKKVEMHNYDVRKNLLKYDNIVNEQRKNIFDLRREIMTSEDLSDKVKSFIGEINGDLINETIPKNSYIEQWEIGLLEKEIFRIYSIKLDIKKLAKKEGIDEQQILDYVQGRVKDHFKKKDQEYGAKVMRHLEQQLFLITLDSEWKDHLLSLDKLRYGINLRAYAQKDPLIEYKREAFDLFSDMMMRIEEQLVLRLAHAKVTLDQEQEDFMLNMMERQINQGVIESRSEINKISGGNKPKDKGQTMISNIKPKDRDPNDPSTWGNVGRNQPCPCMSGKKYKHCHGS